MEFNEMTMEVLVPAQYLIGKKACKAKGDKLYLIVDEIKLFGDPKRKLIPSGEGVLFLLDANNPQGNVNVIKESTRMRFHATMEEIESIFVEQYKEIGDFP